MPGGPNRATMLGGRLYPVGGTVPESASITGHSRLDEEALLDVHYLGGKFELAEMAMLKMAGKSGTCTKAANRQNRSCPF